MAVLSTSRQVLGAGLVNNRSILKSEGITSTLRKSLYKEGEGQFHAVGLKNNYLSPLKGLKRYVLFLS